VSYEKDSHPTMKKDTQELFLHSRYASLGETLGSITHQWKQPLNAIVSIQNRIKASMLYAGGISDEKLLKLVDASYDIARHLADTIDVFYGFLLPKSDTQELFYVVKELENIKKLTEYSFENSDIEFLFDIRSSPKLYGNGGEFAHAILNIVLNAKEALHISKSKTPKIWIMVNASDEECLIWIWDNAGGIPIKPPSAIFEPYVTSKEDGGGLGLFIAKKIIEERFGGKVNVRNKDNGALFTIKIPLSKDETNDLCQLSTDEANTLEYINQLIAKVTELEEVEKSLKRWSDIFYDAKWGIAVENREDGTFESVNMAFAQMYGYGVKELSGIQVKTILTTLCQNKKDHCFCQDVHIRKDGSSFHAEMECMEIKSESGESFYRVYNVWDVTERKKMERELQESEKKYRSLVEGLPDNVLRWDTEGRYVFFNIIAKPDIREALKKLAVGKRVGEIYPDGRYALLEDTLKQVISTGQSVYLTRMAVPISEDKQELHDIKLVPEFDEEGNITSVLGLGRDMTEFYILQDSLIAKEKEFRSLADNIPDNIVRWDTKGRYLYINAVKERFMREKISKEVLGKTLGELYPNGEFSWMEDAIFTVVATKKELRLPRQPVQKPSGSVEIHDIKLVPEFDDKGELVSVLGIGRDMTELNSLLYYDPLTALPNRALAKEVGGQLLYHSKKEECKVIFILIDIDNFNAVNNSLGYEAGNTVIKSIASRLKESMSEADIISRYAGDEFLIVLKGVFDAYDVVSAVEKTINIFEKPFELEGHVFAVSVSMGVSFFPDFGDSFCTLFQKAEIAMYSAKKDGKNTYHIYNDNMDKNPIQHLELNNKIKDGIKNSEFILHYQPQIDISQNRIVGVEALIRWKHPELGMIPPLDFIPAAESSGLIVSLGEWIIKEACRQASEWKKEGVDLCVAVNISAVQFKRGDLKKVVKESLDSCAVEPCRLELELTESILMHDAENTLLVVNELKELGVQLSIDDFGTGYSSLAYLKRFAVDKLKIDKSFVADILHDKDDATITNTIIQMAKNLGLKTIAEGVESREIVDALTDYGCDEIQGYYFAKPMDAEAFAMFYRDSLSG